MKYRVTTAVAAALAAAGFAGAVSAATVDLAANETQLITLHNVSSADLSFAIAATGNSYTNYGGYIKWSTRADGRQDQDGPWGTCYECGYAGGSWDLAYNPWNVAGSNTGAAVSLDFGGVLDTIYVWVRATYGAGVLSYAENEAGNEAGRGVAGGSWDIADDAAGVADGATGPVGEADLPAVPLPAAGLLLASALAGMAALRRRKAA
ncbi:VPLPA-CTERM sorting domain-containing protein [Sinirhodobacter populi]|uniref:VPLPA-CTERM sorting domain-containing protein n=1 Tax=Paenirhodobacter populi TaxID=2306993 RepID=A0A443K9E4_9RHOB|nr:VPLPA-CTERM sorting domain-containing protein [Sinirhodobacter populi]RWR29365.1 VPLPA-CTERM sorting domain-containing protein [Sinirhodobacter populi]